MTRRDCQCVVILDHELVGARMNANYNWPAFPKRMDGTTISAEASIMLVARQAPNFWNQNMPDLAVALQ